MVEVTTTGDTLEKYGCPGPNCTKAYNSLADLFQHITASHKVRQRWLIIDRKENKVYVTDKALGSLNVEKLKELEKPLEVTTVA